MSAPDWISAVSTLCGIGVAAYGGWIALNTYKHQIETSDVQLALKIFDEINRYWDRIVDGSGAYSYNSGQILAQFEIASGLFNDELLHASAQKILADHIVEVFTAWQADEVGKKLIRDCYSSKDTFIELHKFARSKFPKALLADAFGDTET